MMRILAILLVIALAGCFGIPPGGASFGDEVTVRYVALDPETGMILESRLMDLPTRQVEGVPHYDTAPLRNAVVARLGSVPAALAGLMEGERTDKAAFDRALVDNGLLGEFALAARFELGSGTSPLGFHAERRLVGMQANETKTISVGNDTALGYTQTRTVARHLDGGPFTQTMGRNEFSFYFQTQPSEGAQFQFNILHDGRVESVQNDTVRFRVLAEEGQSAPIPAIGARAVTQVTQDGYSYRLEPEVGQRFVIRPPQGNQQTPLGLEPGGYRARSATADEIVYDYTPHITTLVERPLRLFVEMVDVVPQVQEVPTGEYGKRRSAVLPPHQHGDGADDGHDDGHGHTH